MDCQSIGLLPREFDALDRHKTLWLLVHCIAKLPPKAEESFGVVLPRRFFASRHRDRIRSDRR